MVGVSTQQSPQSGAVLVLAYLVASWKGEPVAATDAMALGFFSKAARPPLAFQAHRELLAVYDARDA